jgi:hypothetical protein
MEKAPLRPKLINGKVWVPSTDSGYRKLPEDDPSYREIYTWIDSQRFVELLDWIYHRNGSSKNGNGASKNGH